MESMSAPILIMFGAASALLCSLCIELRPKNNRKLKKQEIAWFVATYTGLFSIFAFYLHTSIKCGGMEGQMLSCAAPGRPFAYLGEDVWMERVSNADSTFFVCLGLFIFGVLAMNKMDQIEAAKPGLMDL